MLEKGKDHILAEAEKLGEYHDKQGVYIDADQVLQQLGIGEQDTDKTPSTPQPEMTYEEQLAEQKVRQVLAHPFPEICCLTFHACLK